MSEPLILSDDPIEQCHQLFRAIPHIQFEITSFEAFYLITGIQTLLSHPSFSDRSSIPAQRIEGLAKRLEPHVARHPIVQEILEQGWRGVELVQEAQAEAKLARQMELPETRPELNKIAKAAKIRRFSALKKSALIERLKALPPEQLIAAIAATQG